LSHNYGKIHHFSWENPLFLWPFYDHLIENTKVARLPLRSSMASPRRSASEDESASNASREWMPCTVAFANGVKNGEKLCQKSKHGDDHLRTKKRAIQGGAP